MSDVVSESIVETLEINPESMSLTATDKTGFRQQTRRLRFNQFMKLVRRSHLYAGLFMTPWVFLYGITAFLFNHPTILPDFSVYRFEADDFSNAAINQLPDAIGLSQQVVDQINSVTGKNYALVRPESARFTRPFTLLLGNGRKNYLVTYDLETKSGTVRSQPVRSVRPASDQSSNLPARLELDSLRDWDLNQDFLALLPKFSIDSTGMMPVSNPDSASSPNGRQARSASGRADAEGSELKERPARKSPVNEGALRKGETQRSGSQTMQPGSGSGRGLQAGTEVEFEMMGPDQKQVTVSYNIQTGQIVSRPSIGSGQSSGNDSLSTRRFFLRLHTAHGFPQDFNARWAWALAVDLMFLSMVGWGITGLVMWYHMKHLRRIGGYVLILSLIVSIAMAVGMHSELVTSGR